MFLSNGIIEPFADVDYQSYCVSYRVIVCYSCWMMFVYVVFDSRKAYPLYM